MMLFLIGLDHHGEVFEFIATRCAGLGIHELLGTRQSRLVLVLVPDQMHALLTIGVSHHERLAVLQRIERDDAVRFSEPMWVASYNVEECYVKMLPGKRTEVTAEDVAELSCIFGKNGKLPPERLS